MDDRERKLIVGSNFGDIVVLNITNAAQMKVLDPVEGEVSRLAYIKEDKAVVASSWGTPAMGGSLTVLNEFDNHGYGGGNLDAASMVWYPLVLSVSMSRSLPTNQALAHHSNVSRIVKTSVSPKVVMCLK